MIRDEPPNERDQGGTISKSLEKCSRRQKKKKSSDRSLRVLVEAAFVRPGDNAPIEQREAQRCL